MSEEEMIKRIDKVIAGYEKIIEELYNELDRLQKENEELKAKTNLKDLKEKLEGLDINYYKPLIEKIEELLKENNKWLLKVN